MLPEPSEYWVELTAEGCPLADAAGAWPAGAAAPASAEALRQWLGEVDAARLQRLLQERSGARAEAWLGASAGTAGAQQWLLLLEPLPEAGQAGQARWRLRLRDIGADLRAGCRQGRLDSLWDMSAGIAHEFNNRLTAALGNVFRLRARIARDSQAAIPLERLEDALLAMDQLTGRLLQFTALGGQEPRLADLAAWWDGLRVAVEARLPANVRLYSRAAPAPLRLRVDGAALSEAVMALVDNAVEAMPNGQGRLDFSLRRLDREAVAALAPLWLVPDAAAYAVLALADDGCGIGEELLDRAVEPFVSTRQPGRGLGLSVVLGIAQRHNGGLHMRRRQPRGTEVMLFLPLAEDVAQLSGQDGGHAGRMGR